MKAQGMLTRPRGMGRKYYEILVCTKDGSQFIVGPVKLCNDQIDALLNASNISVQDEPIYVIPEWVADAYLAPVWCFFYDLLNFRNPFSRG